MDNQKNQPGSTSLAEYTLILGLIAILAVLTLVFFGDQIRQILDAIGDKVN